MDFLELLKKRESVRKYTNQMVEREKIEHCLEASRLSPSACNSQPWRFVIVDEPELSKKIAEATFSKAAPFNKFTMTAPVFAVIVVENTSASAKFGGVVKGIPYHFIDIGIAAEHFCLQALEEGLGTCILGWFNQKKIKEILEIPKKQKVALVISLGYHENKEARKKIRKDMDSIRTYNKY